MCALDTELHGVRIPRDENCGLKGMQIFNLLRYCQITPQGGCPSVPSHLQ